MRERILLMGPPGSGKSHQLIKTLQGIREQAIDIAIIDLEDKLEATLLGLKEPLPKNFFICTSWEEYRNAINSLSIKDGSWILVDRVDLSWSFVQRWFTQQKYNEELSERLVEVSKGMKRASMFVPRFDQGSWQVVNEAYESTMLKLLYKTRCNIVLTAGIRATEEGNPLDVFGSLGVAPRGQKELPHQPHSVFLLHQRKVGKDRGFLITTGKDLPGREPFEDEPIFDFYDMYVARYWKK